MVFGASADPVILDGALVSDGESTRPINQMFEGLVTTEPGGTETVPALAESWEASEDGLQWTFTLRTGVTFHDGEPFNAEAVCYNFERMFDQNEAGQVAGEYWGYVMGAFGNDAENSLYQGCEATGEFEAMVTISGPTSGFPTFLSLDSLATGDPSRYQIGLGMAGTGRLDTRFRAAQLGAYVQDQWQLSDRLLVTGGVRVDVPWLRDQPSYNPVIEAEFGRRTDEVPSGLVL